MVSSGGLRKLVKAVAFLARVIPVALALKQGQNSDVVAEQFRQETFEDVEVDLAAQQSFNCPVETDQSAWFVIVAFLRTTAKSVPHDQYSAKAISPATWY